MELLKKEFINCDIKYVPIKTMSNAEAVFKIVFNHCGG